MKMAGCLVVPTVGVMAGRMAVKKDVLKVGSLVVEMELMTVVPTAANWVALRAERRAA